MTTIGRIAFDEWRLIRRTRVAVLGVCMVLLLSVVAAIVAAESARATSQQREEFQARADQEFDSQPDRHPHRMVHYGHFVFRPLNPLAGFDAGIDGFAGQMLFLEGHRQNSANFSDARQSSLLLRFGQLTPAYVLQVLAPLLLVFLGFNVVAREHQHGTLQILLAQGVGARQLLVGKCAAVAGAAGVIALPALLGLFGAGGDVGASATIAAGYLIYLLIWSVASVLVSGMARHGRDALLALVTLWAGLVILVPRLLPELAIATTPLATRFETDIAVQRDLEAIGDSHDVGDPHFSAFRNQVLARYGVSRIEQLPINYEGLLAVEGERLTSALYERYLGEGRDAQQRQSSLVNRLGIVSPTVALRRLSSALAQTDLGSYRDFLDQVEAFRFGMMTALDRLEADKISYADDVSAGMDARISRRNWQDYPEFQFAAPSRADIIARAAPPIAVLCVWLTALALLILPVGRRLESVRR